MLDGPSPKRPQVQKYRRCRQWELYAPQDQGHRSKSQRADPEITNVTEGAHLLENISSDADNNHKPSTRSALLIAEYKGPPCDGTNSKIAVSKSLNNHGSSPARSHQEITEVFHVQSAILDSLYNPRDVKPR